MLQKRPFKNNPANWNFELCFLFPFPRQGEKNNGYEVLYQNMKYGLSATKELAEYFRERSNLEEYNSKLLTKLANKAGSGGGGTFSPLWIILKSTTERLSELHAAKVQKLTELVKNINKYAEELHKKHKSVKEEESSTQDAVHVSFFFVRIKVPRGK